MADEQTYTMNETTPESEQFSEEEMDSLRVGEQMQAAEDKRLAGKYENALELEKAYIELEKKLGNTSEEKEEVVDEAPQEEETDEPEQEIGVLDKLWEERESGFSDDTLQELAKTNPGELAKAYLELRQSSSEPQELSNEDIESLKDVVGGEESYNQMVDWAKDNLSQQDQDMFDQVVDNGDPLACYFAIQVLQNKFNEAVGSDGTLIQGKAPSTTGNQFRSQAELVQAMADPRYDNDPAYRQDVMNKLTRSDNVNF